MDGIIQGSEFGQIRAFLCVAELGSFTRAAELLGVSPSSLSQTIRGLEERIGVRLLNRTTRSVALTDAGEALAQRVRPAMAEIGAAVAQVMRLRDRPTGIVRVHALRLAAETHLEPILAPFHEAYPDIVLDVTADDAIVDIVTGGYDIAMRLGEVIERDMVAVRIGPDLRQIAVASPGYVARHGRPATPRDLHAHRCIRWRWPGRASTYNWEFFHNGTWFEVAVDGPLIVNSQRMAVRAALDGVGIAFWVEQELEPLIAAGRLVRLLNEWSGPFPGFFLCYPQQRQMAPALRAFIDFVRAQPHAASP